MNKNLQQNQYFFNRWAGSYDSPWLQWWMMKFHAPVLGELNLKKRLKVLDLSCGTGQLLHSLYTKNQSLELTGVDYSPKMLQVARKRLPPAIKLVQADVHALPFNANTFDYVVSTEAFHHYYDQKKALQEMKRVAKKGASIIIADINFFFRFIHWFFLKLEPGCVKINSKQEIKELFKQSGLSNITQHRYFAFSITTRGSKALI